MPTLSSNAPENEKSTHLHWQCGPRPDRLTPHTSRSRSSFADPTFASRTLPMVAPLRGGLRPSLTRPSVRRDGYQGTAGAVPVGRKTATIGGFS